jgi:N-methylhydantoinase A/acetophenone carboxylase
MMLRVGIDVGGTFTDFVTLSEGGEMRIAKTPTTHYDLSVGFMKGMRQLARNAGEPLEQLLARVESIRYSTTVGTNALIERTGPKLGLLTTAGFEDTIFIGRSRSWADGGSIEANRNLARIRKAEPLILPEMVVGISARMDCYGNIIKPLRREDVLEQLQLLVDRGAMGFVVSLLWSFVNPGHERAIKQIIEQEYPEDYLGSMPVFLSSDISPKGGEYTRTMTAIVNAYIHGTMADELGKLGNELRDAEYRKPLILVHNTGGTKKISRTRAILTHNAGPVAGLHGAAVIGDLSGDRNIIFTDMGGTSFDIGLIADGAIRTQDFIPVIDRWRTNIPAIEVKSIGAGGGSMAWINRAFGGQLEVGPQSAGSMPGPACYDQGGVEATVTDADLVLGFYNPDNYLGGDMLLDTELAREAIQENIAAPLGIDVIAAAYRMKRLVDARMGQEVFNEVALKGHDPRQFTVFAGGGAGPAHACGFAPYIGVKRILIPEVASVFGGFGASTMRIKEVWDKSRPMRIFDWRSQSYSQQVDDFNGVVREMRDLAIRDLRLEGYGAEEISFELDLEMRFGSQYNLTKISSPKLELGSSDDFRALGDLFMQRYAEIYSPEATFLSGGINIETFYLTATVSSKAYRGHVEELRGSQPDTAALVMHRPVYWNQENGFVDTPVYDFLLLHPGNRIPGPAIIESRETTCVIEPNWAYKMDSYRNGVLDQTANV